MKEKFRCEICNASYSGARGVKRHMDSIHRRTRTYECDICEKELCGYEYLKVHYKVMHKITNVNEI